MCLPSVPDCQMERLLPCRCRLSRTWKRKNKKKKGKRGLIGYLREKRVPPLQGEEKRREGERLSSHNRVSGKERGTKPFLHRASPRAQERKKGEKGGGMITSRSFSYYPLLSITTINTPRAHRQIKRGKKREGKGVTSVLPLVAGEKKEKKPKTSTARPGKGEKKGGKGGNRSPFLFFLIGLDVARGKGGGARAVLHSAGLPTEGGKGEEKKGGEGGRPG